MEVADIKCSPYESIDPEDEEAWLAQLTTEGFVVLKAVASEEDVNVAKNLVWKWLNELGTGIERTDLSSWKDEAWPDWRGKKYGSCKSFGAAHSEANWYLRGLPRLKQAFAAIYKTEDLIVSMDGMIIWRPWWGRPELEDRRPGGSGLHMDQNPWTKPGFHCVQGMLPLCQVNEGVGGTSLVPGSHVDKVQQEMRKAHPGWKKTGRDYCVINDKKMLRTCRHKERLVQLNKGDLLLWDSRLVHAGRPGDGSGVENDLARASLCVCMAPREKADPEVLEKRKEAVAEGCALNHCPFEVNKKFIPPKSEKYIRPHLSLDQINLI